MDFRPNEYRHFAEKKRQYVRKNRKGKQLILFVLCIAVLSVWVMIGAVTLRLISDREQKPHETSAASEALSGENTVTSQAPQNMKKATVTRKQITSGALILVSELVGRAYNFENAGELITLYGNKSSSYKIASSKLSLNKEAFYAAEEMFNAYNEETKNNDYQITRAYRTEAEQEKLTLANQSRSESCISSKPLYSEHHTGYAFDLNVFSGGKSYSLENAAVDNEIYAWIYENAHEYGFILRYEKGKENLTGMAYDGGHFRYVGKGHAAYMKEHGLSLEEYVALLYRHPHDGKHLTFEYGGVKYDVCFVAFSGGEEEKEVLINADLSYVISGENSDGVIITQFD